VIATKENQDDANGRREKEQPILRKHVIIEHTPTIALANFVLNRLIMSIKRRQVNVGRRFVDIDISVGCAEDAIR
jgi:hypothetical protein